MQRTEDMVQAALTRYPIVTVSGIATRSAGYRPHIRRILDQLVEDGLVGRWQSSRFLKQQPCYFLINPLKNGVSLFTVKMSC